MRKRIFSLLLGLCLVAGLMPMGVTTAFAADGEEFTVDEMNYRVVSETDKTVELSSVTENCTGNITILGTVDKDGETYTVTGIGRQAFFERIDITNVKMPDSIITIGEQAFFGCGIKEMTIPKGVTTIGYGAFASCNNLENIIIPDSVTTIEARAFNNCVKFKSVTIPGSITSMGDNVFKGCTNLTEVTISNGVATISNDMFSGCRTLAKITIPDSVTSIGDRAFVRCAFTEITIPNSVTKIGYGAFALCNNLENITIPDSVTYIGENAFDGCETLSSIKIPCDFDKGLFSNTRITVNESDSNSYEVSSTDAKPVKGTFTYSHTFDKEIATEDYLKSPADCINAAVYYKSCSCGTSSEGAQEAPTFTKGMANGHSYIHHDKVEATAKKEGKAEHYINCIP